MNHTPVTPERVASVLVRRVAFEDVLPWIMGRHYALRRCPVQYAFGAYRNGDVVGVVTYGTPASSPLRNGICGPDWSDRVLELNRLCCENSKNMASMLISRSLSMLPKPSIVVSFADTSVGHVGYVYQACNFLYTGLSAKRTNWTIRGMEHLHGATVADISRGMEKRAEYMREKYGDDFYLKDRPRKHRYIYFVGNKKQKRELRSCLRYEILPFPKGESRHYDTTKPIQVQQTLFI